MKKIIKPFILYLVIGLISFVGYKFLYSTKFDLGTLCEASTECFAVTQRIIIYDWLTILFAILAVFFIAKKQYFSTIIISIIFLYNLLKIDSNSSIPLLSVLNFFLVLFTYILLSNTSRIFWIVNSIGLFLVTLLEILQIAEVFYYNKNYTELENFLDLFILSILVFSIIISIYKRKKTRQIT